MFVQRFQRCWGKFSIEESTSQRHSRFSFVLGSDTLLLIFLYTKYTLYLLCFRCSNNITSAALGGWEAVSMASGASASNFIDLSSNEFLVRLGFNKPVVLGLCLSCRFAYLLIQIPDVLRVTSSA